MRWAVEGCRPVTADNCFRLTGSGYSARASSSAYHALDDLDGGLLVVQRLICVFHWKLVRCNEVFISQCENLSNVAQRLPSCIEYIRINFMRRACPAGSFTAIMQPASKPTTGNNTMGVITNIEDLRILAERRVPRMFYDYADSGSWTESTYRANSDDFAKIKLRQRVAVEHGKPQPRQHHGRPAGSDAGSDRADRADRHAACGWRDPGGAGGGEIRRAVHAVDHEHLLDRGHRRPHRPRRSGSRSTS